MNPFTERSRITDPSRFTGRWREVGMVFERLERRQPVILAGAAGAGKSSLLTHVAQAAGAVLEIPDLDALFLDLAVLPAAATAYRLAANALRGSGETAADLEAALVRFGHPVLLCLDGADRAIAAGWGEDLLERLARIARRSVPSRDDEQRLLPGTHDLMLVAAAGAEVPALSERFASVRLGALAPSEVRLLAEAYLDEGEVTFSADELRALGELSVGHPAYLQRAAFHLYESRSRLDYDWRAAYLAEARERPIPGAPLPPEVFRGEQAASRDEARLDPQAPDAQRPAAQGQEALIEIRPFVEATLPLAVALVALQLSGSWLVAVGVVVAGYALVALARRR
ncbi:MAG: ATP-binding protein [Chloroflexales bacterium]|nr:ATP-binding protein [Chloroflexales bacterium]